MSRILWGVFTILILLWVAGLAYGVAAGFIHLLLIAAVVVLVVNLIISERIT